MTVFSAIAVLLAGVALAFVLPALLGRGRRQTTAPGPTNVALYREQLQELEADVAAGTLAPGHRDEAKREIERRVLEDAAAAAPAAARPSRAAAIAIAFALPVAALAGYLAVGNPGALSPAAMEASHGITREQVEGMVARLADRLKQNPDDAEGWTMLGRSYSVLGRYPDAAGAYANAVKRSPPSAQLLADYANALAMAQGQRLAGEPERLVMQALALDPRNVKALMLAGSAAFEKKDYKGAIAQWERILAVEPPDSEVVEMVKDGIEDARKLAGPPPGSVAGAASAKPKPAAVTVTVRLDPSLAAKVAPDDTVFVFARAVDGPRMPLAVARRKARDLPLTVTLDDSMAMAPSAKLSGHDKVIVGARISRGGTATPQSGDLEGYTAAVSSTAGGLQVVIGHEVR